MGKTMKLKWTIQDGDYQKEILLPIDINLEKVLTVSLALGFTVTVEAVKRDSE